MFTLLPNTCCFGGVTMTSCVAPSTKDGRLSKVSFSCCVTWLQPLWLYPHYFEFSVFMQRSFVWHNFGSYSKILSNNDIQGGCVSKTTQMVHQHLAPVMSSYSLMVAVEDIWCFDSLTQKDLDFHFNFSFASLPYLAGNKNAITTLKRGADAVQKSEKTLLVIYDEESIIARLGLPAAKQKSQHLHLLITCQRRDRKHNFAIKQAETVHVLMQPSGAKVVKKSRPGPTIQNTMVVSFILFVKKK